jgi:hypothetical protein
VAIDMVGGFGLKGAAARGAVISGLTTANGERARRFRINPLLAGLALFPPAILVAIGLGYEAGKVTTPLAQGAITVVTPGYIAPKGERDQPMKDLSWINGLPGWARLYPGAVVVGGGLVNRPNGVGAQIEFTAQATPDQVADFYRRTAREEGFRPLLTSPTQELFDEPSTSHVFGYVIERQIPTGVDAVLIANP